MTHGGMFVHPDALFPEREGWALGIVDGPAHAVFALESNLEAIAGVVRFGARGDNREEMAELVAALGERAVSVLTREDEVRPPTWDVVKRPGVYRRAHASLVIQSETTSILVDPVCLNVALPQIVHAPMRHPDEEFDAIAISHSHSDHFHLPSIFANSEDHTPVLVPDVPEPNLLTLDQMGSDLEAFGQHAVVAPWNTTLTIGDIEVDVLPFYGEQPTRDAPGPDPRLRSWGNCYRFNTPQFSAAVFVDSGEDPLGSCIEVAKESYEKRGPVDLVLSCLRGFESPFFGGLQDYWATLPFARLQELYAQMQRGELPFTTGGIEGAAAICKAAHARFFLPYANGFEGIGQPIQDIGWGFGEPAEQEATRKLRARLQANGSATEVEDWNSGDRAEVEQGRLRIHDPGSAIPCP